MKIKREELAAFIGSLARIRFGHGALFIRGFVYYEGKEQIVTFAFLASGKCLTKMDKPGAEKKRLDSWSVDELERLMNYIRCLNFDIVDGFEEIEAWTEFKFLGEPIRIKGATKHIIGRVGLVREQDGLINLMYFGVDNKYTTITSFREEVPETLLLASADLSDIATVISVLTNKLNEQYEKIIQDVSSDKVQKNTQGGK